MTLAPLSSNSVLRQLEPRLLSVNLLRACNLSCRFCSEESGPAFLRGAPRSADGRTGRQSLATEEVFAILDQAAAVDIKWVAFVGGEPTLREDLPRIVRHAHGLGIGTGVITNGYRLGSDRAYTAALADAGLYVATFSWYGKTDEAVARATGHRDYRRRSLAGIREAAAAGLRIAFDVVLTTANVEVFIDGSAWMELEEFDPAYVFISPLMPAGRAGAATTGLISDGCGDLALPPREYLTAFAAVQRRWVSGPPYPIRMPQAYVPVTPAASAFVETLGPGPFHFDRSHISCRDVCGTKLEVRWDGRLNACCYYPYAESLTIGNVFDRGGFERLLQEGAGIVATLDEAFTCPAYPDQIDGFGLGCPYRSALGEI